MRKCKMRKAKCRMATGFASRKSGSSGFDSSFIIHHSAFTLLEVLVAVALFGLAVATLLASVAPVQEALFRLSFSTRNAGDLELAKAIAESSKDRATLLAGGASALPDGRSMQWRVELEPTTTEMLFLVRLTADIADGDTLRSDYLRFDPRWSDPTGEKPRWLEHSASGGGDPGGGASGGDRAGRPGVGGQSGKGNGGEGAPGRRRAPATGGSGR